MRLKRATQKKTEMDIIPMVDIVFQLIIFFLVATQVKKNDTAALTLPVARYPDKYKPQPRPPMILNILSPASAKLQGKGDKVYVVGGKYFNLDGLTQFIKYAGKREGWSDPKSGVDPPIVRVRADESASFVDVQEALMIFPDYKIWQIRLVTRKIQ